MDELYSGSDWAKLFTWELIGRNEDGELCFRNVCPADVQPLVIAVIEASARRSEVDGEGLVKSGVGKRLRRVIEAGVLSRDALARLVGMSDAVLDEVLDGSKDVRLSACDAASLMLIAEKLS